MLPGVAAARPNRGGALREQDPRLVQECIRALGSRELSSLPDAEELRIMTQIMGAEEVKRMQGSACSLHAL